eukprot:756023-Hanusia_phi.AAC.8
MIGSTEAIWLLGSPLASRLAIGIEIDEAAVVPVQGGGNSGAEAGTSWSDLTLVRSKRTSRTRATAGVKRAGDMILPLVPNTLEQNIEREEEGKREHGGEGNLYASPPIPSSAIQQVSLLSSTCWVLKSWGAGQEATLVYPSIACQELLCLERDFFPELSWRFSVRPSIPVSSFRLHLFEAGYILQNTFGDSSDHSRPTSSEDSDSHRWRWRKEGKAS